MTIQRMEGAETSDRDRKGLVTDRLNVVGESHSESDLRRTEEKEYTTEYSGTSDYWIENEFLARDKNFWEKVRSLKFFPKRFSYSERRPTADPFKLRFLQMIKIIDENVVTKILETSQEIVKGTEAPSSNQFDDVIKFSNKYIDNSYYLLNALSNGEDGLDLSQREKERILSFSKELDDIQLKYITIMVKLFDFTENQFPTDLITNIITKKKEFLQNARLSTDLVVDANNIEESMLNLYNSVENLRQKLVAQFWKPNITVAEIIHRRSLLMQQAANNRYRKKGVWKIGTNHIEDMEKMHPQRYNLVTKADFDYHFDKWRQTKEKSKT